MAAETLCGYPGRDEALVSYLYDDLEGAERSAFDTHLVLCTRCRTELTQLRGVRGQLRTWEPPTVISHQSSVVSRQSALDSHSRQSWWREIPAWAQVAAALLCLGIGAGLANLDVRYDQQGLSIHTGWLKPANVAPYSSVASAGSAPWRGDLAALERQLRTEFRSADAAAPGVVTLAHTTQPSMSEAELLKRVRALVDESERKQNRELALRVGEMVRDVDAQRQADLRKIDQSLGLIQSNTGVEVMKQRQLLNYLVRVSAQK